MSTTTSRGYGRAHQERRKRDAKIVEAGEAYCAKCGGWIRPDEPWDEGHNPLDRGEWIGPLHQRCNRNTVFERSLRRPRVSTVSAEEWLPR